MGTGKGKKVLTLPSLRLFYIQSSMGGREEQKKALFLRKGTPQEATTRMIGPNALAAHHTLFNSPAATPGGYRFMGSALLGHPDLKCSQVSGVARMAASSRAQGLPERRELAGPHSHWDTEHCTAG